jgi:crotonobetainyl-CoA:carnitine CoA-transferase CaiB-like acyl-CoA transferase
MSDGPLAGVRVLDLSSVIMGPYATQVLADLGADVITVESAAGDTSRIMSSGPVPQLSGIALNLLRNKRNVDLDLKSTSGHAALFRIIASCDAFVTNLRPRSLKSLGLTYDEVASVRPDIVYCQAQGFASDTDRADDPAYDDVIQAGTGVADAFRRAYGVPMLAPTIMADKVCGLTIAYALVASLLRRERTGIGQHIEVPMVDVMKSFMLVEHGANAVGYGSDAPAGYPRILTPHRRPQQTRDGWIHILPYTSHHYAVLFEAGGRTDLHGDPRCATLRDCILNSDFLYQAVHSITQQRTTAEWLALCTEHQIPATPVADLDEMVAELPVEEHPVAGRYHMVPSPVRFDHERPALRRHAPLIGQHTEEVLAEVGLGAAEIRAAAGRDHPDASTTSTQKDSA